MRKLTHEEILKERLTPEGAILAERNPVSLMLINIRSLYNVGSIFRTADAGLANELILCGYTPKPPRIEISKTSLGAVDSVPWGYFKNPLDAIREQKEKGYKIIALELTDKKRKYNSIEKLEFPVCIVLGNELTGIEDIYLKECDDAIEIPMWGVKHSLNVSVAAGIALMEAVNIYSKY
jgi:23S rRNA (guanosine2251-2'-O)-methyltransferase